MNIAVFYNLNFGGAKRAVYEQVEGLNKLGHKIDIYTTDQQKDYFDFKLITNKTNIYYFDFFKKDFPLISRFINDFKTFYVLKNLHKKIAIEIDKNNYDIVLVHPDKFTQAPFILRFLKTKNVYYCQEPLRIAYEYNLKADIKIGYIKYLYEFITRNIRKKIDLINARSATYTIASCLHVRERMIEAYGVYPFVSYLGVNKNIFKPKKIKILNQVYFVGNKDVVNDGYDLALNSINLIPKRNRPKLKIVEWVNDNDKRITDVELSKEYEQSIAVLCTNKLETFGLVPLEVMSSGGVVIATNVSGHRESIINNNTGFLIDFDLIQIKNLVLELSIDKNLSNKIRKKARKYVELEWNLDKRVKELEKLLIYLSTGNK